MWIDPNHFGSCLWMRINKIGKLKNVDVVWSKTYQYRKVFCDLKIHVISN